VRHDRIDGQDSNRLHQTRDRQTSADRCVYALQFYQQLSSTASGSLQQTTRTACDGQTGQGTPSTTQIDNLGQISLPLEPALYRNNPLQTAGGFFVEVRDRHNDPSTAKVSSTTSTTTPGTGVEQGVATALVADERKEWGQTGGRTFSNPQNQ